MRADGKRRDRNLWSRRDLLRLGGAASAGLLLGGCGRADGFSNVILVSIDTLRADRLHCYGNPRPTSPAIDRLASEGVRFRNAFSTAPWTLPAHLGLFTSREPGRYFQSVGIAGWSEDKADYPIIYSLQGEAPTIASTFRDAGFDTVGFHGAMLTDAVWGLDRGFREYRFSPRDDQFFMAEEYISGAPADRPFFLFVHSYIVHRPYENERVFGSPDRRPPGLAQMDFEKDRLGGREVTPVDPQAPLYGWQPVPDEIEYWKTVYDGGIRAVDQLLGGLLEALRREGLYEDATIVVTADHGEEFWEHIPECSPDHNHSLFDELLHIPLIVKLPDGRAAGKVVDGLVRIHDVGPTLFEQAGLPLHAGATGRSLLERIDDESAAEERTLYAGCTYMGPTRHALRTSRYKYIHCPQPANSFRPHFEVPPEALYDLVDDPGETVDLAASLPEKADELRRELHRRRQADLPLTMTLDDPTTRRYLKAMGLERHAERLLAAGKGTARIPLTDEASQELLDSLRSLGYI